MFYSTYAGKSFFVKKRLSGNEMKLFSIAVDNLSAMQFKSKCEI